VKKELFKELNAHIRACDNKSIVLNTAYVASILVLYSDRSTNLFLRALYDENLITNRWFNIGYLAAIALVGYAVLYVQFWFRGWKVHYMNLLHLIWLENKAELGDNVPMWMKTQSEVFSFDNLIRMLPFIFNFAVMGQISFVYARSFSATFLWVFAALICVHMLI
jgi:hypothetical protein